MLPARLQVRDVYALEAPVQLSHHALYGSLQTAASEQDAAARAAANQAVDNVKVQTLARVVELVYARRFAAADDQAWVRQAIIDRFGPGSLSDPAALAQGSALDLSESSVIRVGTVYMACKEPGETMSTSMHCLGGGMMSRDCLSLRASVHACACAALRKQLSF